MIASTAETIVGTFFGLAVLFVWGLFAVGLVLAIVVLIGMWRDV